MNIQHILFNNFVSLLRVSIDVLISGCVFTIGGAAGPFQSPLLIAKVNCICNPSSRVCKLPFKDNVQKGGNYFGAGKINIIKSLKQSLKLAFLL